MPTKHVNPSLTTLYKNGLIEGNQLNNTGALVAYSGDKTGRSPKDKRIVRNAASTDIWWAKKHLNQQNDLYVVDAYAGHDPQYQKKIRIYCIEPYHCMFMMNMLIPAEEPFEESECDFIIYNVGSLSLQDVELPADIQPDESLSTTLVGMDLEGMRMVIYGTRYAGEMKKGILTLMMYLMPLDGHLTLHSSANADNNGMTTMFFGLSGTGKTTLSADPNRNLIGDDEHVWTDNGIYNIEGGCYAKCINLSAKNEPDIYNAIRFGAVLENVIMDSQGVVDFKDNSITDNTRCSYPLKHINNAIIPSVSSQPDEIILLTCDAYGVLPPIAQLTEEQALFFFVAGYTSKIAGTEVGVTEPVATFSSCFGEPFLVWHPEKYGKLLLNKIKSSNCNVWLLNTGWIQGPYGKGKRIPIKYSRKMVDYINQKKYITDSFVSYSKFNFYVPQNGNVLLDTPDEVLFPIKSWASKKTL